MADAQVNGRIEVRIVELEQHILARHTKLRGAKGNESRYIKGPHTDQLDMRMVGGEGERAAILIVKGRFRLNANPRQQRAQFFQYPAFRHGNGQVLGHRGWCLAASAGRVHGLECRLRPSVWNRLLLQQLMLIRSLLTFALIMVALPAAADIIATYQDRSAKGGTVTVTTNSAGLARLDMGDGAYVLVKGTDAYTVNPGQDGGISVMRMADMARALEELLGADLRALFGPATLTPRAGVKSRKTGARTVAGVPGNVYQLTGLDSPLRRWTSPSRPTPNCGRLPMPTNALPTAAR
jgi:hypothetical protein